LDPSEAAVLTLAGFAAGFINTLAGGGSAITLSALEWITGSAGVANATNRIAILLQNVVGVAGFHTGRAVPFKEAARLAAPAILGGCGGAFVATQLDPGAIRIALSLAILFAAVASVLKPPGNGKLAGRWTPIAFFFAGFYSGFVQVGVGFVLLACLVGGLGYDLVKANAIKVFIVLIVTIPVLAIFGLKGQLWVAHGLVLACGSMGGAWIASRLAIKKGAAWVRIVVVIAAVAAIAKLLVFRTGI